MIEHIIKNKTTEVKHIIIMDQDHTNTNKMVAIKHIDRD